MTKHRPSRRRSFARASAWCGIVLASVLMVAWVGSAWWEVALLNDKLLGVRIRSGRFATVWPWTYKTWQWSIEVQRNSWPFWEKQTTFEHIDLSGDLMVSRMGAAPTAPARRTPAATQGFHIFVIPLWPFILAFGIPSIWTLLATRRRRDPLLCPHCRYPRGSSPICTECGHTLPNPPQPH